MEGYRWKKCLFRLANTPYMYAVSNDKIAQITNKINTI